MLAIAYDMTVADARQHHPRGDRQAYLDIELTLGEFGFGRVQASVFASKDDDRASLFGAVIALRALRGFGRSVSHIRAFRMDRGSDLTAIVKAQQR